MPGLQTTKAPIPPETRARLYIASSSIWSVVTYTLPSFFVILGNNVLSAQLLEVSLTISRNGVPSRKGCVVNRQMTTVRQANKMSTPPPPPPSAPPLPHRSVPHSARPPDENTAGPVEEHILVSWWGTKKSKTPSYIYTGSTICTWYTIRIGFPGVTKNVKRVRIWY